MKKYLTKGTSRVIVKSVNEKYYSREKCNNKYLLQSAVWNRSLVDSNKYDFDELNKCDFMISSLR